MKRKENYGWIDDMVNWRQMERATASGLEYQPEDGAILPRGLVKDSHEKGKRRHARHLVDPQGEKEERELEC